MTGPVYENYLKGEYAVENGEASLIITKSSCFRVREETLSLVDALPPEGGREAFVEALSAMGIERPDVIFDRLLEIGALRIKQKRSPLRLLSALLNPDIRLIPAGWQEKFFSAAGIKPSSDVLFRYFPHILSLAAAGLLISLAVSYTGIYPALQAHSAGETKTLHLLALVLLGSVIHELGHSYAAAAAGIAFRPIGLSLYLFFPVFYANVSGMERLPFRAKASIDLGGFFSQSAYMSLLLAAWYFSKAAVFLEAVRWTSLVIVFNMNPLLKTDLYWLYSDFRKSRAGGGIADLVHRGYLLCFVGFSIYLFRYAWLQAGQLLEMILASLREPSLLLAGGHKIVLGVYMIIIFFMASARRLEETRQEWLAVGRGSEAGSAS